jgi:hypothetical protein
VHPDSPALVLSTQKMGVLLRNEGIFKEIIIVQRCAYPFTSRYLFKLLFDGTHL